MLLRQEFSSSHGYSQKEEFNAEQTSTESILWTHQTAWCVQLQKKHQTISCSIAPSLSSFGQVWDWNSVLTPQLAVFTAFRKLPTSLTPNTTPSSSCAFGSYGRDETPSSSGMKT
jgi:hypothetical protein